MRASRDDLLHMVAIHHGDVVHRLHLKKKFISGSSGRVSCAGLLHSKHCKLCSYGIQNFYKCFGNTLSTLIK